MLLTQALRKRQTLKNRIDTAQANLLLVGAVVSSQEIPENQAFKSKEALTQEMRASLTSYRTLVDNYYDLVSKINIANSTNFIRVGDKEVTLATAIEMRNSLSIQRTFVSIIQKQKRVIEQRVSDSNEALDRDIQKRVQNSMVDGMTADEVVSLEQQTRERLEKRHLAKIHDPLNIHKLHVDEVDKLSELIDDLDINLNIANATIVIDAVDQK